MQLVNRLQSITLALLAAFGASTSAVAKVHVPEKLASGVFAVNYDPNAPVDNAGTLDYAGRASRCSYELVSGQSKWLNRDLIAELGGWNLYAFVRNQPTSLIDPFGLADGSFTITHEPVDPGKIVPSRPSSLSSAKPDVRTLGRATYHISTTKASCERCAETKCWVPVVELKIKYSVAISQETSQSKLGAVAAHEEAHVRAYMTNFNKIAADLNPTFSKYRATTALSCRAFLEIQKEVMKVKFDKEKSNGESHTGGHPTNAYI
jgi:hypothetical protein